MQAQSSELKKAKIEDRKSAKTPFPTPEQDNTPDRSSQATSEERQLRQAQLENMGIRYSAPVLTNDTDVVRTWSQAPIISKEDIDSRSISNNQHDNASGSDGRNGTSTMPWSSYIDSSPSLKTPSAIGSERSKSKLPPTPPQRNSFASAIPQWAQLQSVPILPSEDTSGGCDAGKKAGTD